VSHDPQQYLQRAVQTATPGQLVVMLYDGFQRFTAQARAAFEAGDVGEGGLKLSRAQAIITELRCTLDMSHEPIATNLASIYEWITQELMASRMERDVERLTRATAQMSELRSSWAQVASTARPAVESNRPVVGVNLAG
jgi:flagellar secretion chaperone FliS